MTNIVEPALTAEEWEHWPGSHRGLRDRMEDAAVSMISVLDRPRLRRQHALAALCLYQRPFGFTQEDVDALRGEADKIWDAQSDEYWSGAMVNYAQKFDALASRIAALLPPEKP